LVSVINTYDSHVASVNECSLFEREQLVSIRSCSFWEYQQWTI